MANLLLESRLPLLEWASWWDQTLIRWRGEGLPADAGDHIAVARHFGLDLYRQFWVPSRGAGCPRPVSHGAGIIKNEAEYDRIREHLFPESSLAMDKWVLRAKEQARGESVLWFTLELPKADS